MNTGEGNRERELAGLLAEFDGPRSLVEAARAMRRAGYTKLDAFSPFPIHELDRALAIPSSRLPWLVLAAGLLGGVVALGGQWWTNAVDYPYLISGKPLFSLPANMPVTFEVIILCSALAAFGGMLLLNKLPRLANPLLRCGRISKATSDGFLLLIDAADERFSAEQTSAALRSVGAAAIEACRADVSPARLPRAVLACLAILAALALVPPLLVARARSTTSELPPLRTMKDMDFQPKFKSQTKSAFFADRRVMRPPVAGAVARGELQEDERLYRGLASPPRDETLIAADVEGDAAAGEPVWAETIPVPVSDELMRRGQLHYNIHCAACHGRAGDGDGPVSARALELEQGTWVPPTSLHADHVRRQPAGQLFNTITNGVRKMPGYGDQISPEDRWSVVLYLRALQRTRDARPSDLPADEVAKLRELN